VSPVVGAGLVVLLIAANGLFVAAEFAYVAVRRSTIEGLAAEGGGRAQSVLKELSQLSFVLSGAQFGITATSLLVGFLAEDSIGGLLRPALDAVGLPERTALAVSITGAFVISTVAQMVFGELAPKNYAIARPERVSLAVVPVMRAYGIVLGPVIRVFDGAAAAVSGWLGIEVTHELLDSHTVEDLGRIIAASGEEGALSESQASLLTRAIGLVERRVSEVMVPRPDVVWLAHDRTAADLLEAAVRTGHSRFPVHAGSEDEVVGTVHVKDLLRVDPAGRTTTTVRELAAPPLVVPESFELRQLLARMRLEHRTFAVVVDEYGGTAGIVTMEDVLEELVGEIEDEFDRDVRALRRIGAGRYIVHGTLRADRLRDALSMQVPDGDYETVAGFVLDLLGAIPAEGDSLMHDGWRIEIASMDGLRIAELAFERTSEPAPATGGDQ